MITPKDLDDVAAVCSLQGPPIYPLDTSNCPSTNLLMDVETRVQFASAAPRCDGCQRDVGQEGCHERVSRENICCRAVWTNLPKSTDALNEQASDVVDFVPSSRGTVAQLSTFGLANSTSTCRGVPQRGSCHVRHLSPQVNQCQHHPSRLQPLQKSEPPMPLQSCKPIFIGYGTAETCIDDDLGGFTRFLIGDGPVSFDLLSTGVDPKRSEDPDDRPKSHVDRCKSNRTDSFPRRPRKSPVVLRQQLSGNFSGEDPTRTTSTAY